MNLFEELNEKSKVYLKNLIKRDRYKDVKCYLKKGIKIHGQFLKKKLIESGLKKDECEICGLSNIWNNKLLILSLDHINGDHYDNRIENIRITCPNCHSQTDTFCGKLSNEEKLLRRRNIRINSKTSICITCGKPVLPNTKTNMCLKCSGKLRRKVDRPNIDRLKQLIKKYGYCAVARKYGVTDNAVRKWIDIKNLPSRQVGKVTGL